MSEVTVRLQATAPWAADPFERMSTLPGVPRRGDVVAIWHNTTEHYFDVLQVTWPDSLLGGDIRVHLSTEGLHPDEVVAIFASTEEP